MEQKQSRSAAVKAAQAAWGGAPLHIRTLAGAYMGPVLAALEAISADADRMERALCHACGVLRVVELDPQAGELAPMEKQAGGNQHGA